MYFDTSKYLSIFSPHISQKAKSYLIPNLGTRPTTYCLKFSDYDIPLLLDHSWSFHTSLVESSNHRYLLSQGGSVGWSAAPHSARQRRNYQHQTSVAPNVLTSGTCIDKNNDPRYPGADHSVLRRDPKGDEKIDKFGNLLGGMPLSVLKNLNLIMQHRQEIQSVYVHASRSTPAPPIHARHRRSTYFWFPGLSILLSPKFTCTQTQCHST